MNNFIYVTGYYFQDDLLFYDSDGSNNITLGLDEIVNIFVAKLDLSGNWIWANKIGSSSGNNPVNIDINDDNIYLSGVYFGSSILFYDSDGSNNFILNNSGSNDIFVAHSDINRIWKWVNRITKTSTDIPINMQIYNNHIYINGTYLNQSLLIYDSNGSSNYILTNSGSSDIFVAQSDVSGNWQWVNKISGTDFDNPSNMQIINDIIYMVHPHLICYHFMIRMDQII